MPRYADDIQSQRATRHNLRVLESHEHEFEHDGGAVQQRPAAATTSSGVSLLKAPAISRLANGHTRAAVMRQAQQTYGNRAVQRYLRRGLQRKTASAPTLPVQRDTAKQRAIRKVTSAATLTSAERATLPTLPTDLAAAATRYKDVVTRLTELNKLARTLKRQSKTLSADELKEQTDLTAEKKQLEDKIIAGKSATAKSQMEDAFTSAGTTVRDWFNDFEPDAEFLGLKIRASTGGASGGVHKQLADRLRTAQAALETSLGCRGSECATILKVYDISGLRQPQAATGRSKPSFHCFGLAVDINYKGNPFIGNQGNTAVEVIERATLLVTGTRVNVTDKPARGATAGQQWERLHGASEALKEYFKLADDTTKLAAKVEALQKAGDTRDAAAWTKQIKDDYVAVWGKGGGGVDDFEHHEDPAQGGFMDHDKRLVEALESAGLYWGGQYNTAKDIMHFDWRNGTIRP